MLLRNCPKPEILLETISIPAEMGRLSYFKTRLHTLRCNRCKDALLQLKATWDGYFQPEPEVASSLVRVYSRLQRDETLILKGWKFGDFRTMRPSPARLFFRTWGFPTGIAVALGFFAVLFSPAFQMPSEENQVAVFTPPQIPLSPIRVRDKNSVKVRYVQPELLSSMEFETVSHP